MYCPENLCPDVNMDAHFLSDAMSMQMVNSKGSERGNLKKTEQKIEFFNAE